MSLARFRVVAYLDRASRPTVGTVTIDRASGIFTVRPLRRRRVYELPLAAVAELVTRYIIRAELAERTAVKRATRRLRRR